MNNSFMSIGFLVLLLVVMYFLMIRPQKKREKETNQMRAGIQVGDEIITIGGIKGKVVKTKEESIIIQVGADKVKFEMMRWSVSKVEKPGPGHGKAAAEETEEPEVKKAKPKKLKKAAPAEEAPATEEAAPVEDAPATEEAAPAPEKADEE